MPSSVHVWQNFKTCFVSYNLRNDINMLHGGVHKIASF